MNQTIDDLKNILKMQKQENEEEIKVKQQELNMKNKEIELIKSSLQRKYAAFEERNNELSNLLENKEKELLEERLKRDEFEWELKRLSEELEEYKTRKEFEDNYTFHNKNIHGDIKFVHQKLEHTDTTYDYEDHSLNKDKEFGQIYVKLSSELNSLRNEIKNMKSEWSLADVQTNSYEKNYYSGENNTTNNENYADSFKPNKRGVLERVKTSMKRPLENDSIYNQMKMSKWESNINSELERLNDLERKLNQEIDLPDESDDALSYEGSKRIKLQNNLNNMYYAQSENQSPNQESWKRNQMLIKSKDSMYWNIASNFNSDNGSSQNVEILNARFIPKLSIDRMYN